MVFGIRFRAQGKGVRGKGLWFKVLDLRFRVEDSRFQVGFRV
jgi:hypothetical protein